MPSTSLPMLATKSPSMTTYVLLSVQFFMYVDNLLNLFSDSFVVHLDSCLP